MGNPIKAHVNRQILHSETSLQKSLTAASNPRYSSPEECTGGTMLEYRPQDPKPVRKLLRSDGSFLLLKGKDLLSPLLRFIASIAKR